MRFLLGLMALVFSLPGVGDEVSPASNRPIPIESQIGVDSKLGNTVAREAKFKDENGNDVTLSRYLGKRPALLALVYYECPSLCGMVMGGLFRTLAAMQLKLGADFDMIFASINPKEGPTLASAKKKNYLKNFMAGKGEEGIHFLTGTQQSITALAESVGFRYVYDEKTKQYAHPGAAMVLTPEGKVSQYHLGVDFPAKDVRLSLVNASGYKIGTWVDKFLLYCYHYDPTAGRYGFAIFRALKLLSVLTVLALAVAVALLLRRERIA